MNLNIIQLKFYTEDLAPSITKNSETLIEQTHRQAEETLEIEVNKSRETFSINPPIQGKGDWMFGIQSQEVYNYIFNINTMNIKFELYTDIFNEFSFEELKDEVEQILNISDIITYHLQHENIGPRIIEAYKKLRLQKSSTDGYIILLMGYAWSAFRDSETYLRIVVGLYEDVIQLNLKQYISIFVTYELSLEIYAIKDFAEAVYAIGEHEETLQSEYDDITKKTKLILTLFGDTFGRLRFNERSFSIFSGVLRPFTIINLLMQFILIVLLFTLVINI